MGYRNYNRNRRRKRGYSRGQRRDDAQSPVEDLAEAIITLIFAGLGLLGRGIAKLWRKVRGKKDPPGQVNAPRAELVQRAANARKQFRLERAAEAAQRDAEACRKELPFCRARRVITKGERGLWYPLSRAVRGKYRLFCKVRLADVVNVHPERRDERFWFRKIHAFHVDFVICDPKTTEPLLVIEHDDRSHRGERSVRRDAFKDRVLTAAGLPILRVAAQSAYDPIDLAEQIERHIAARSQ